MHICVHSFGKFGRISRNKWNGTKQRGETTCHQVRQAGKKGGPWEGKFRIREKVPESALRRRYYALEYMILCIRIHDIEYMTLCCRIHHIEYMTLCIRIHDIEYMTLSDTLRTYVL